MVPDKYEAGAGRGRVNPPVPKGARYDEGGSVPSLNVDNPAYKFGKTYFPKGAEVQYKLHKMADDEGKKSQKSFRKGEYLEGAKSLGKGTAAALGSMVSNPVVGVGAAINRAVGGKKDSAEESREKAESAGVGVMKKGGMVKSSASSRADGIAQRGKTRGKVC
jgi:hypothetical protein